ncbi:dienelactone hydrolase [Streptomyces tendae]
MRPRPRLRARPRLRLRARPRLRPRPRRYGVGYTSEIHPGTVHGFTMSDTDAVDSAAPHLHWDRLLSLLDRTRG